MGFPLGVKQLALRHPHPVREPLAQGHGGTSNPQPSCALSGGSARRGAGPRECLLRIRQGAPLHAKLEFA